MYDLWEHTYGHAYMYVDAWLNAMKDMCKDTWENRTGKPTKTIWENLQKHLRQIQKDPQETYKNTLFCFLTCLCS